MISYHKNMITDGVLALNRPSFKNMNFNIIEISALELFTSFQKSIFSLKVTQFSVLK